MSLPPLRIEIGGDNSDAYKSIDRLIWDDVPAFSVLTGLNGSGKTQLLEFLAHRLTGVWPPHVGNLNNVNLSIEGDTFTHESVAFIPSRWEISGGGMLGVAQMQQHKQQLFQQLKQGNVVNNRRMKAMRTELERVLGVKNLDTMNPQEFIERLPDDYAFMLDEEDVTSGLSYVFLAHKLRIADMLVKGIPTDVVNKELGPAPWDVLNETFQVAEFPYRVVSPAVSKLVDPYELTLEVPGTDLRLSPQDLSSGEKVLLALVYWLYISQYHNKFPRLFLLDEPDAHLHPSMTRHLLNIINKVLVERYNVRTIITTHSPSTVALAPPDSLFEMYKDQPRIRKSSSKAETIGLLTSGLVTVSPTTRYVLVEDEDDVTFYEAIRDILTDYGPSRDPRSIKPAPSIVFLPASIRSSGGKVAGGKSVVDGWVNKFDQPPLNELIRGVVDGDGANAATDRILVLGRYSIENYYLDPFVVFGLLLEAKCPPTIPTVSISSGDEHQIRSMDDGSLQAIVDTIQSLVEPELLKLGKLDTTHHKVTFTNGRSVQYPAWMLYYRGHDLLPVFQAVFGGPRLISPPRLEQNLRRIRLIPSELADIFDALQS